MRFSNVVLAYFVIGVVMFGGGAVAWDDAGVGKFFVSMDDDGDVESSGNATENLDKAGGIISDIVNLAVGPILFIYNLVVGVFIFLNWPVVVLESNNAPPVVTALLGGSFSAAFYLSVVRLFRTSA